MSKSEDDETVDRTETVETAGKGADGDAPSDQLETASMNPGAERNETVDPATQKKVLERDRYRCRACSAKAPAVGASQSLRSTTQIETRMMSANTTWRTSSRCVGVATHGITSGGKSSDVPIRLTAADDKELLSHDYEILRILNDNGPLRTGAIAERLTAEMMSLMAVRERLWHLGGLDNKVPERTEPLVTKDIASQEWGSSMIS